MRAPLYRPFARAGDLVFVSGQVGVLPDGTTAPGGVAPQTAQALDNLRGVLKSAGLNMTDVVKVTVFLEDLDSYDAMNVAYEEAFPDSAVRPARSAVAVRGLVRDFVVEIEACAYQPAGPARTVGDAPVRHAYDDLPERSREEP